MELTALLLTDRIGYKLEASVRSNRCRWLQALDSLCSQLLRPRWCSIDEKSRMAMQGKQWLSLGYPSGANNKMHIFQLRGVFDQASVWFDQMSVFGQISKTSHLPSPSFLQCDSCRSCSLRGSVHSIPGCSALISLFAAIHKGDSGPFVQEHCTGKSQQYRLDLSFCLYCSLSRSFHLSSCCCILLFHLFLSPCSSSKQGQKQQPAKIWTKQTDEGQWWEREQEAKRGNR